CRLSSRFWAVTTTSSMPMRRPLPVSWAAAADMRPGPRARTESPERAARRNRPCPSDLQELVNFNSQTLIYRFAVSTPMVGGPPCVAPVAPAGSRGCGQKAAGGLAWHGQNSAISTGFGPETPPTRAVRCFFLCFDRTLNLYALPRGL